MPNNQIYHKDYTEFGEPYQLVLPLNLEGLVPDDDSVRLLSHELEGLDYSLLYQAYSAKGRNPAVDPKTMFKILTYLIKISGSSPYLFTYRIIYTPHHRQVAKDQFYATAISLRIFPAKNTKSFCPPDIIQSVSCCLVHKI